MKTFFSKFELTAIASLDTTYFFNTRTRFIPFYSLSQL